jgi:hypothetical protein
METLSKKQFELERNLFHYLKDLETEQCKMYNLAKDNIKIAKGLNDDYELKGWKLELKNIENRLRFIDTQIGQFPIYIDLTYSDYLKVVKPSNK